VYVQLVRSEFLWCHHKFIPEALPDSSVTVPADWRKCPGAPSLWDLHVEQLQIPLQMNTLSDHTQIAKFKLSDPGLSSDRSVQEVVVPVSQSGTCHGVLMWWTADMSGTELSMSPWDYTQWRDHWLQAVQLLPEPLNVKRGDQLSVRLGHDDYSMWFHVSPPTASLPPPLPAVRPLCTCGVHTAWSRSRIAMLNDTARSHLYLRAFTQVHIMCTAFNSCPPILLTGGA
jgi:protein arginine N-methyltransferase 7